MGSIALVVYTTWRSMDRKAKKAVRCSPAQGVLRGVLLLSGSGVACWCQLLMVVVASCVSETRPGTVPGRVQLSVYPSFCLKGLMHDE